MDTFKMMASNVIYAAASGRIKLSFDFVWGGCWGVTVHVLCEFSLIFHSDILC